MALEIAEYDINHFDSSMQSEADRALLVKFFYRSVPDRIASDEEGRPIYKEREYIDIRVPGSRDNVCRPATVQDKGRFPMHYQAFKNRIAQPEEGTPLSEWPGISRSLAEQLSFENIKTVEQLSELNDSLMHNVKNGQGLKQRAKDWLEFTKDSKALTNMRSELEERDKQIEDLSFRLNVLSEKLEEMQAGEGSSTTKKGK